MLKNPRILAATPHQSDSRENGRRHTHELQRRYGPAQAATRGLPPASMAPHQ